jgi:hypothetical protein
MPKATIMKTAGHQVHGTDSRSSNDGDATHQG